MALGLVLASQTGVSRTLGDEPNGLEAALSLEQSLIKLIAKAESSVVAIARVRREEAGIRDPADENAIPIAPRSVFQREPDPTDPNFVPHEYGTGVVVDANGLILTAYHVVGDVRRSDYYVWADRKPFRAKVLAADPWMDLAVLQIPATELKPIEFGDTKALRRGQIAIALGNPYAIARDGTPSASWGIISNLNRAAPVTRENNTQERENFHQLGTLIQTDAKLNFGTSGGALLNLQGQMIGLTTSLTALNGIDSAAGFAMPVDDDFRKSVDQLKQGKAPSYGFLGIAPGNLALIDRQQGKFGVVINEVFPATPAAAAGLRNRDVITHVNGEPIHSRESLIRNVGGKQVGTIVELTLERAGAFGRGKPFKANVALVKKYITTSRPVIASVAEPNWRGVQVDFATAVPFFPQASALIAGQSCVAVVRVEPDSPAWKAGLRSGDFISHVGKSRVASPAEFQTLTESATGPVELRLLNRESENVTRTVEPPPDLKSK